MNAFDVDPTHFASTSLACGAIAIDPRHPDRVYVAGWIDQDGSFRPLPRPAGQEKAAEP